MKNSRKKRAARERRVLLVALLVAAVIVTGSTFAWFTSKDEVTNRLSASANYGVSIAEDFTPPENLLPGQVVNKDVSIVNTGNIDALVRVHLEGAMTVLKEQAVADEVDALAEGFVAPTTDVTDENLKSIGLTLTNGNGLYFRTLSKIERDNPEAAGGTNNETNSDAAAVEASADDEVNHYSEVETVQAGGYLAYASGTFKFTPEKAGYTYTSSGLNHDVVTQVEPTTVTSAEIQDSWYCRGDGGVGLEIDSDNFLPTSDGLFIFRRNITVDADNGSYYEYSGYYYKAAAGDGGGQGTYYALHYLPNEGGTPYNSDYVIFSTEETAETNGNALTVTYETAGNIKTPVVSVKPTSIKLFSAEYTRRTGLVGTYANSGEAGTVVFTNGAEGNAEIKLTAAVTNIGTDGEKWTALTETDSHTYFYYNNDVEEGDTTAKLVDSLTLAETTKRSAYLALDFDLNVILDSVQVTVAEDGTEDIAAAKSEWPEIDKDGTEVNTYASNEISTITWVNSD